MSPTMYKIASLAETERANRAQEDISSRGNILNLIGKLVGSGLSVIGQGLGGTMKGIGSSIGKKIGGKANG